MLPDEESAAIAFDAFKDGQMDIQDTKMVHFDSMLCYYCVVITGLIYQLRFLLACVSL